MISTGVPDPLKFSCQLAFLPCVPDRGMGAPLILIQQIRAEPHATRSLGPRPRIIGATVNIKHGRAV